MILLPNNKENLPDNENELLICNGTEFWKHFDRDLRSAQKSILIIAPYVRKNRVDTAFPTFEQITERVNVRVVTKDPAIQWDSELCKIQIERLRALGWEFLFYPMFHQKIAVIDDSIAWSGSLNILSHGDDSEQMHRFTSAPSIRAIIEHIDREIMVKTRSSPLELPLDPSQKECRECGDRAELISQHEKAQLRCQNFPKCRFRAYLSTPDTHHQSWLVGEEIEAYDYDEYNAS